MVVSINPAQQPISRQLTDPRDPLERNMDKLLRALQIANAGFGIAVDFKKVQNMPTSEEASRLRAAELTLKEAQAGKIGAETGLVGAQTGKISKEADILPTAEQAAEGRQLDLQGKQLGIQESQVGIEKTKEETKKVGAETRKLDLDSKKLEREMNRLANSPRGVTDLGKPMDSTQLKSQSFLDRSVKATDRMKELSPKVSPELMSKQLKALREMGKIPIIGGASDFIATSLGEDAMQTLPESDRQYLLNAAELSNAILRDETGAQANAQELALRMQQFVPAPGDTSDTLEAKAELIDDALDGLRTKTGKFEQPLSNTDKKFNYKRIRKAEARAADERLETAKAVLENRQKRNAQRGGKPKGLLDEAIELFEDTTGIVIPANEKPKPKKRGLGAAIEGGRR